MDAAWEDAIRRADLQEVRSLLDRGTDVDSLDRHGQTALMLAAHAGHDELVKTLIAHRAELNHTSKYGLSALMLALVAGYADVARLLAEAGADLSLQGSGAPGFAGKTAYNLTVERDMGELLAVLKPPRTAAQTFRAIDAAFRSGDLAALRAAVDDPDSVPNGPLPMGFGYCLEYAIYHSPLAFIRTLLELGADPSCADSAGFPPLIAALSCSRSQPGSPARTDTLNIIQLLLAFRADPNQRGINDYTPLHMAVGEGNLPAVEALLRAGADPRLRTRIDDYETPLELAERAGLTDIATLLRETCDEL